MWSSTEITVYLRSARGGSGRKVTVRSAPVLALVNDRSLVRSSKSRVLMSILRSVQHFGLAADEHAHRARPVHLGGPLQQRRLHALHHPRLHRELLMAERLELPHVVGHAARPVNASRPEHGLLD